MFVKEEKSMLRFVWAIDLAIQFLVLLITLLLVPSQAKGGDSTSQDTASQDTKSSDTESSDSMYLVYTAVGLSAVAYVLTQLTKRRLYRVVPSTHLDWPGIVVMVLVKLIKYILLVFIQKAVVTVYYLYSEQEGTVGGYGIVSYDTALMVSILTLRLFRRAMASPMMASIEMLLAYFMTQELPTEYTVHVIRLLIGFGFSAMVAQFAISRSLIFVDKVNYMIVSYLTAFKNKK